MLKSVVFDTSNGQTTQPTNRRTEQLMDERTNGQTDPLIEMQGYFQKAEGRAEKAQGTWITGQQRRDKSHLPCKALQAEAENNSKPMPPLMPYLARKSLQC